MRRIFIGQLGQPRPIQLGQRAFGAEKRDHGGLLARDLAQRVFGAAVVLQLEVFDLPAQCAIVFRLDHWRCDHHGDQECRETFHKLTPSSIVGHVQLRSVYRSASPMVSRWQRAKTANVNSNPRFPV